MLPPIEQFSGTLIRRVLIFFGDIWEWGKENPEFWPMALLIVGVIMIRKQKR